MRILLDTHALIWNYQTSPQMTPLAISTINDPANEVLVSPASYWEIAIKLNLGKYIFSESFHEFIQHAIYDNGFSILPIEPIHTEKLIGLKPYHKDPFDRLLIAQAMTENIPLMSIDTAFDQYPILRVW